MNRRKYLKTLATGTIATGLLIDACTLPNTPKKEVSNLGGMDRQPEEIEHFNRISAEKYFDANEMNTISSLSDIIIPKDDISGGAIEAKVPDFIEFIVKDKPQYQLPMRGGLKWLDMQCLKLYGKSFSNCGKKQQIEMVEQIAWPLKAKPEMQQGVAFFNLMRDLTATGFFTSEIGIKDIGYVGNKPNQWDGVPQDVLNQYGMKYDEKTLKECVKFDS